MKKTDGSPKIGLIFAGFIGELRETNPRGLFEWLSGLGFNGVEGAAGFANILNMPMVELRTFLSSIGLAAAPHGVSTSGASDEEIRAAATQYVRKVSGFPKPSKANEAAFERAVDEVAEATSRLLDSLVTTAPPKDREVVAAKARARAAKRFGA